MLLMHCKERFEEYKNMIDMEENNDKFEYLTEEYEAEQPIFFFSDRIKELSNEGWDNYQWIRKDGKVTLKFKKEKANE